MPRPSPAARALRPPLALALAVLAALVTLLPPARAATPRVHALVNARIGPAPGQVIERGTIVIRNGVIEAVGPGVAVPADARIWDAESLTVYAGLIDAFVTPPAAGAGPAGPPGRARPEPADPARGAAHPLKSVTPENRVVETAPLGREQIEALRAAGFAAAQIAPRSGIVRGQAAVVGLADAEANLATLRPDASLVISLETARQTYPGSLMGAIAVIRQSFLDAAWYRDAHTAAARAPGVERPETNVSFEAMQPAIAGVQPVTFVADEMLEVLRAAKIAAEASVTARIVGAGDEYKRAREIAALRAPLVVPVNFPEPPNVSDPWNTMEVATEELRAWQEAPGNPAALSRAGVTFALTSHGLKDVKSFRGNVAKAIARGLGPAAALAAVTTVPARMLGLEGRLGTIAPGRIANLTVTRGDLFSEKGQVREVWVDGRRYETATSDAGLAGTWDIGWGRAKHALIVRSEKDTTVTLVVGKDSLAARDVFLQSDRVSFTVQRGEEPAEEFALVARFDRVAGSLSVAGRGSHPVSGWKRAEEKKDEKKDAKKPADAELVAVPAVMGNSEPWRLGVPAQPPAVLVRNATIWTAGPQGTLHDADLLARGGRIVAVGKGLRAPAGAVVIDGAGKHVIPGIIDEHSHSAILGNVNECTNNLTCEVRIQDVINSESLNLYRQLAGGTTVMHLLHGSCNSIGGQAATIKARWGAAPDDLVFAAAPPTVKFALGENPKQSNWGNERTDRYPKSRAGVEQSIREAFVAARDYRATWKEHRDGIRKVPPRRDLQKEALVEIIEGRRLIHCHSYRQDEILMLMRLCEEFGFRVNTFTHILEGYKVANEMAAHGVSAMGFSDWWAYKMEVIDAIPWSPYIMWSRGVNVGMNSDSDELARRLNTEAAKAIKYGGVPAEEALKMVTLNPAKSLKVEDRVGSLEAGKDADFSVWNGPPLSPYSMCLETWIEGRKYFDRAEDLAGREPLAKEREALIAKARAAKKEGGGGGGGRGNWPPRYLEDTDMSGNECGHEHDMPFRSEAERRAVRMGGQR